MIQKIKIKNFESHRNTVLELSKGINIIQGQSDHGKSSIIRSIYWVKDNKPSGTSMISFWNRDSKDNPKHSTSVTIENSKGEIVREKSPDLNGYRIGDSLTLEAVGQTVPEEVFKFLNISEINIQGQFDRPFLLDDSPQEVARLFNKTVKLDIIDKVQSRVEKERRATNSKITSSEELLDKLEKNLKSFDWIDEVESKIEKALELETKLEGMVSKKERVEALFISLRDKKKELLELNKISSLDYLIRQIDALTIELKDLESEKEAIEDIFSLLEEDSIAIEKYKKLKKYTPIIERIDILSPIIKSKVDNKNRLDSLLLEKERYSSIAKESESKAKELEESLPDTCPLCGAKKE